MSTMPPQMPPMPPQGVPAKKISPLVWILGGIAVLMFGIMLTCGVVGFFAMRAVKNAGFDSELMQKNPGLAMAKMAAALHPDLEVVSTNDRKGIITMREKSTGKTMTFRFDPDKKTLVMTGDDGKDVTVGVTGDDKNGAVTVQTADGTMRFGQDASKTPAWVPVYPGSSASEGGIYSADTSEGSQSTFTFKTKDAPAKVLTYYQDQLKGGGFTVNQMVNSDQGGMLSAEDADKKRTVVVTVGTTGDETQASIMAVEKK